ncbi:hypothetical protein ACJX0J_020083, partial [Zea mays]
MSQAVKIVLWTEAGYTIVAHEKINQDEVQEDIEINEGDIDVQEDDDGTLAVGYEYMSWDGNKQAPLDDEGQAKDVILDDSERGLGFGYESINVWHKEKRNMLHVFNYSLQESTEEDKKKTQKILRKIRKPTKAKICIRILSFQILWVKILYIFGLDRKNELIINDLEKKIRIKVKKLRGIFNSAKHYPDNIPNALEWIEKLWWDMYPDLDEG